MSDLTKTNTTGRQSFLKRLFDELSKDLTIRDTKVDTTKDTTTDTTTKTTTNVNIIKNERDGAHT